MIEKQVKEEVMRYIDDKAYNYAILIDGEWGSGKTYFIKNVMSKEITLHEAIKDNHRQIKYISLYGCKSINDVQENIAWSFAENARKKIKEKVNWEKTGETISENVLLSSKKIGNAILKKFLPETSLYEITSDWLNLGAFIFIFDDLERCECSLNEVFGFLNELVEHENTKVIIIANEREISRITESQNLEFQYQLALSDKINWPQEESNSYVKKRSNGVGISFNEIKHRRKMLFPESDENEEYKKIREKLIGVTLRYEPDVLSIIKTIINSSSYNDEYKSILLEKTDFFSKTMDSYCHHNLRTFQFFLSKVGYLMDKLAEVECDNEYRGTILEQIIVETFNQSVKFKSNYKPSENDLFGLSREQEVSSVLIKQYVENGEFIFEDFKKDIFKIEEQLKVSVPNDDAYYLLYYQYYAHTQEWCEEQLCIIIRQIKENRYPVSFYGKIIVVVQRLLELGFNENYMEQIKQGMIDSINSMGEVNVIEDDLWMLDDKSVKEKIRAVIDEINEAIILHSTKVRTMTVKEILKEADWIQKLERYINPDNTYYPREVPIFSKAKTEQWVNNLNNANPEEIDNFRHWLVKAYPKNQTRKNYLEDADTIKMIIKELEKIEETDLIKKACFKWLIIQFRDIVKCNEPDTVD